MEMKSRDGGGHDPWSVIVLLTERIRPGLGVGGLIIITYYLLPATPTPTSRTRHLPISFLGLPTSYCW